VWVALIAAAVITVDQITKLWALQTLVGQPSIEVIGEWLKFTFARNPGGAFSIGTQFTWLFTFVALGVVLAILFFSRRVTSTWWLIALGVLMGGALGNLMDRMLQPPGIGVGHVVDFIQLPNWPIFNIADMAVVGSSCAIVVLSLLGVEPSTQPESAAEASEPSSDDEVAVQS